MSDDTAETKDLPSGLEVTLDAPDTTGIRGKPGIAPPRSLEGEILAKRYRLLRMLGFGGMGVVYEAEHVITRRRFALKTLKSSAHVSEEYVRRFLREARAASAIGHPGIVEVIDAGTNEAGLPYIVMELLHGKTLAEATEEGSLDFDQISDIGEQVLWALAAAHDRGIVHRDVKPENVFLLEGPALLVKVLDFGIAKQAVGTQETALTSSGAVMGTPFYMAPEQARGMRVDLRADLWSVGAMLFHASTGRPPFLGENHNIVVAKLLTEDPPQVADVKEGVLPSLARAIDGALKRDREERWSHAAEMWKVLSDRERGRSTPCSLVLDEDTFTQSRTLSTADASPVIESDDGGRSPMPTPGEGIVTEPGSRPMEDTEPACEPDGEALRGTSVGDEDCVTKQPLRRARPEEPIPREIGGDAWLDSIERRLAIPEASRAGEAPASSSDPWAAEDIAITEPGSSSPENPAPAPAVEEVAVPVSIDATRPDGHPRRRMMLWPMAVGLVLLGIGGWLVLALSR